MWLFNGGALWLLICLSVLWVVLVCLRFLLPVVVSVCVWCCCLFGLTVCGLLGGVVFWFVVFAFWGGGR